ncbi:hypothetical protein JCM24511_06535 [Saitozyma sp. JCM 24511]|nr:hypothetical protein JCM24511_06535 [Saitozyma sp. JCM 24511]
MSSDNSLIPIIEFADFSDGFSAAAKDIGRQFYAACRDVGFAYPINHGAPQCKLESMFAMSTAFFWVQDANRQQLEDSMHNSITIYR